MYKMHIEYINVRTITAQNKMKTKGAWFLCIFYLLYIIFKMKMKLCKNPQLMNSFLKKVISRNEINLLILGIECYGIKYLHHFACWSDRYSRLKPKKNVRRTLTSLVSDCFSLIYNFWSSLHCLIFICTNILLITGC